MGCFSQKRLLPWIMQMHSALSLFSVATYLVPISSGVILWRYLCHDVSNLSAAVFKQLVLDNIKNIKHRITSPLCGKSYGLPS